MNTDEMITIENPVEDDIFMDELDEEAAALEKYSLESAWDMDVPYQTAKVILEKNLLNVARSFVAIGYYLKGIRDTEGYREDGYGNLWDFAKSEFGLSRSVVSRWMAINDRFSKGGNSPALATKYQEYGKSQLQEMLYLTDEQLEEVTPESTVREIREIREPEKEDVAEPETEPHDAEWFVRQIMPQMPDRTYAVAKVYFDETKAGKHVSISGIAKLVQKELAPFGYSGSMWDKYSVTFMNYSNGIEMEISDEKMRVTYYQFTTIMIQMIKDGSLIVEGLPEPEPEPDEKPSVLKVDEPVPQPEECATSHNEGDKGNNEPTCHTCINASSLTGNPKLCATCTGEGSNYRARCITGLSGSRYCGAAAYCYEPVQCCMECQDKCNSQCGWIDEVETAEPVIETVGVEVEAPEEAYLTNCPGWPELLADMPQFKSYWVANILREREDFLWQYLEINENEPDEEKRLPNSLIRKEQAEVAGLRLLHKLCMALEEENND